MDRARQTVGSSQHPEDQFHQLIKKLEGAASLLEITENLKEDQEQLLRLIGQALFDKARRSLPGQAFDFYFWPGYDSIFLRPGKSTRVFLSLDEEDQLPCGLGFELQDPLGGPGTYEKNRSVLWFSRILSQDRDSQFVPGSTHQWLTQETLRAKHTEISDLILDIFTSIEPAPPIFNRGVLSIALDANSPQTYGQQVAHVLNSNKYVSSESKWPYAGDNDNQEKHNLRVSLYDLWLHSTFEKSFGLADRNWLTSIAKRCKDARASEIAFEILNPEELCEPGAEHRYTHWYSLTIPALRHPRRSELGTVMLLTSCPLPSDCLMECRALAWHMYWRWRSLEEYLIEKWRNKDAEKLATALSISDWASVRAALWQTCVRLGDSADRDPLWAHHLPSGGSDWRKSPGLDRIKPWTQALRITSIESIQESSVNIRDVEAIVASWPEHEWRPSDHNPAIKPWTIPPIRALAGFDCENKDLSKLIDLLRVAVANYHQRLECDTPSLPRMLQHDYLWFNAMALADGLYELARHLAHEAGKRDICVDMKCVGATVSWSFEERQEGESVFFEVTVTQFLKVSPPHDAGSVMRRPHPLPVFDDAKGSVADVYRSLKSIGAEIYRTGDHLVIAIGPAHVQTHLWGASGKKCRVLWLPENTACH